MEEEGVGPVEEAGSLESLLALEEDWAAEADEAEEAEEAPEEAEVVEAAEVAEESADEGAMEEVTPLLPEEQDPRSEATTNKTKLFFRMEDSFLD